MIYWLQGRETHVMSGSEQPSLNKIVERFDGRLTESDRAILSVSVSYTHLTLPTSYAV